MAAKEEFDFSSDEENFEKDWNFDENYEIIQCTTANTIPPIADTNKDTRMESESNLKPKMTRMDLNTTKAGMEGLDKEKINQIIHEASKGSKFYENENKKEKQVQKRIEELQRKMASLSNEQKFKAKQTADKIVKELEQGRDLTRTIVHVDMDAFYAAVEMRDDPSLKSKPMAVGGNAMLSTSNYLARRYGVRAGMPGFIAKKLCPNLTIIPVHFDKYRKISHEIREVLAEYDRNYSPMSLDEAYLDITEYLTTLKSMEDSKEDRRMGEVNDEGTGEIEGETENCELGEFESTGRQENDFTEITENDQTEGGHLADARKIVRQLETGKIEVLPAQYFGETSKKLEEDRAVNLAEYKSDEKTPVQHKLGEITHLKGRMVVTLETGKVSATARHSSARVRKQLGNIVDLAANKLDETQLMECDKVQDLIEKETRREENTTDQERFYIKVEDVVKEIRRKIEERTQLTASAGIAANMFLAKVCSDKNKPNGQYYLKPEKSKIMDFIRELPLRKAFGIGRVSEQILTSVLKVNMCYELYHRRDLMQLLFTPTAFGSYLEISLGLGSTVVDVDRERKSISTERTFREIHKPEEHFAKCRELCQELSDSLKEKGLTAQKIGIKLKTIKFEIKSKVSTSSYPVHETEEIFSHAKKLLATEIRACSPAPLRLRLMGVRAAELSEKRINQSKQQTIVSLMKRSGNVPSHSPNPSQAVRPSTSFVLERDEVDLKVGSVKRLDKDNIFEMSSYQMLSEHRPSTSKEYTDDQLSSDQPEHHHLEMGESSSAAHQGVSDKEPNTFNCPVCGRDLTFNSGNALLQLNQHVDKCLTTQVITDILKYDSLQEGKQDHHPSKKRKRESPNKAVKRKPMDRFLTKNKK